MLKNLIILPDGTEIASGNVHDNAIMSCTYTQCCNDGTELSIGSACCDELELKLYMKDNTLPLSAGGVIEYYKYDTDDASRTKIGKFICEKPTFAGTNTYKVIAYDRVSLLDKDLSDWLDSLAGWPYNIVTFAGMVCTKCGLTLVSSTDLVNADYSVPKISGDGITGRVLMQWIGEILCSFLKALPDGRVQFLWYSDNGKTIKADGDLRYFGGGLSYEDYQTAQIEKVQLKVSGSDVGTVYPDGSEDEKTTYTISGNYLIAADTSDALTPVAQAIYTRLSAVQYTPCQVSIPTTMEISAGDIVQITDSRGHNITAYVMTKVNKGQRDTLTCSGSSSLGSTTAANTVSVRDQSGKMLAISKSVDGLTVEAQDAKSRLTELEAVAGEVKVTVQKGVAPYSFRINAAGELIYSTQDTSTMFSINEDGELICTYEDDAPDLYIDDDGYLILNADTSDTATLRTVINAEGEWESVYSVNGEEQSSIRFDFASGRFVFNGTVEATAGDIGGCQIKDGILTVGGWQTGETTIEDAVGTVVYQGTAMWSRTKYDATTREESAIALTPENVYIYGRDSTGASVLDYVSWDDIVRVVNNNK